MLCFMLGLSNSDLSLSEQFSLQALGFSREFSHIQFHQHLLNLIVLWQVFGGPVGVFGGPFGFELSL